MWLSSCGQPRGLGRLEAVEPDGHGLIGREGGLTGSRSARPHQAASRIDSGISAVLPSSAVDALSGRPAWLFA
jgi:hypothetical protein